MTDVPVHTTVPAWYVVSLVMPADIDEEFIDQIRDEFSVEPVQLERPAAVHGWLELYFETEAHAQSVAQRCEQWGAPILAVAVRRCDSRDWHSFWKTHFHARPIGDRLYLKPVWHTETTPESDRLVLQYVPGLSFGTGEHFTTQFCLEMIDQLAVPVGSCASVWDVGCGSGMLGIAAALLGMTQVVGTDNDPICQVQSIENAELNGVGSVCAWQIHDVITDPPPGQFDLVCANLFAPLLIQAAPVLWAATQTYLVLSGIRESEGDAVANTFMDLGARERIRDGDGDWVGLLFEKKGLTEPCSLPGVS